MEEVILENNELKNKLDIVFHERALRNYGRSEISDDELFSIIREITNEGAYSINALEKYLSIEQVVLANIKKLEVFYYETKTYSTSLRNYLYMFSMIENAETMSNIILDSIEDVNKRKEVASYAISKTNLMYSTSQIDEEGYIELNADFDSDKYKNKKGNLIPAYSRKISAEVSVLNLIANTAETLKLNIVKFISLSKAIQDSIKELDFDYKPYKKEIQNLTRLVKTPVTNFTKYIGEANLVNPEEIKNHNRLKDLLKKYDISVDVKKIKVDKKQYDFFKKDF